MSSPLRVLIVEDSSADTELLVYQLRKGGFDPAYERVDNAQEMRAALELRSWDLVIADYNLPEFSAPEALALFQDEDLDAPFIVISGVVGEEVAVAAMKAGAHDFLLKQNLTRLIPVVQRELREAQMRRERRQAQEQVQLLQKLSIAMSISEDLDSAIYEALKEICEATGWIFGEAWIPDSDLGVLRRMQSSFCKVEDLERFVAGSSEFTFGIGKGLPGRVWESKGPVWVRDVTQDPNFPRAALARESGIKAGAGFPVLAGDEVVVVLAFHMTEAREEDERFIKLVSAVAAQLGSLIQRKRAVEALRESRELFEAFMNNTPAVAYMKDEEGRYTYINQPMERLYHVKLADIRGKTDLDWLPPGAARQIRENEKAVLESNQTLEAFEVIPTPDGENHYWWVFKFPFRDRTGRRYVGGVAIDVTDRKGAD